jgi:hypothetical protein
VGQGKGYFSTFSVALVKKEIPVIYQPDSWVGYNSFYMGHNSLFSRDGHQRATSYHYAVGDSRRYHSFPIYKRPTSSVETKLIIGMINGLGILSFVWGILLNLGDWKAAILFGLGALYMGARFVVYCIKSWQDIRWRERHLRKNGMKKPGN